MSRQGLFRQLVSQYGGQFSADAAGCALNNLQINYILNAPKSAQSYNEWSRMSKQGLYDQLVSEHDDNFTKEETWWTVEDPKAGWNFDVLESARRCHLETHMPKNTAYEQLISQYGGKSTGEQAQYAISQLWSSYQSPESTIVSSDLLLWMGCLAAVCGIPHKALRR